MTRADAAHHLAKVFAYLAVGRIQQAQQHADILIAWLRAISDEQKRGAR